MPLRLNKENASRAVTPQLADDFTDGACLARIQTFFKVGFAIRTHFGDGDVALQQQHNYRA